LFPDPPVSLWPDPACLGPVTDLYQLTMMAGYAAAGKAADRGVFELFFRRLPQGRSYLVFAGLEQAIGDVLRLAFSPEQVEQVRRMPVFAGADPRFFDALPSLRFQGDIWAVPEGTVVFAGAPLVRVEAALPQAQWLETFLLASLSYPTLVASKAARVVEAAAGRPVYDYGARRAPGPHAGLLAARSAYLAGCAGTSHVEAAIRLGIPCSGTMAHSWVQSFADERAAFEAFARVYSEAAVMLVDTYDTLDGVRQAAAVEPPVQAVRLDSGDLLDLSVRSRAILDAAGRTGTKILASGDLDEFAIARLIQAGAPIDGFGVGTEMVTSRDAPALSMVYKLVEVNGTGCVKRSAGKKTYPRAKQVFRCRDAFGRFAYDLVGRADETLEGEPLLVPIVRDGVLTARLPRLDAIRARCAAQCAALPDSLRGPGPWPAYPTRYSAALEAEADRLWRLA
jgi:nicotinate phosphoribosyltransferase